MFVEGKWEHAAILPWFWYEVGTEGQYRREDNMIIFEIPVHTDQLSIRWRGKERAVTLFERVVDVLSHELTHWAMECHLTEEECVNMDDYYGAHYEDHDYLLIEEIANWRENNAGPE